MTNPMKQLEAALAALEVPFEEAEYVLTFDKPFYPKVLYYKNLDDAVRVYEHCEKKTTALPKEVTMTISQIFRKCQAIDPWY